MQAMHIFWGWICPFPASQASSIVWMKRGRILMLSQMHQEAKHLVKGSGAVRCSKHSSGATSIQSATVPGACTMLSKHEADTIIMPPAFREAFLPNHVRHKQSVQSCPDSLLRTCACSAAAIHMALSGEATC